MEQKVEWPTKKMEKGWPHSYVWDGGGKQQSAALDLPTEAKPSFTGAPPSAQGESAYEKDNVPFQPGEPLNQSVHTGALLGQ